MLRQENFDVLSLHSYEQHELQTFMKQKVVKYDLQHRVKPQEDH